MTSESQNLLAEYVKTGSESAFRELVFRYLGLVHATAARLLNGDQHRAQDVAQLVFIDLARLAPTLGREACLGGWLHRHTCFIATKTIRSDQRRQLREQQALEMNTHDSNLAPLEPILDEAINALDAADRNAIVLRFFERHDLRSVGQKLGTNEDAAQKRVARALEKLRARLVKLGVAYTVAALAGALSSEGLTLAPVGLAPAIASAAVAAAPAGGIAWTILKIMSMTKLKIGIVSAIAVAAVAAPLTYQQQELHKLREENRTLGQQAAQFNELKAENEKLAGQVAQAGLDTKASQAQAAELFQLRSEVGRLRAGKADAARVQAALTASQNALAQDREKSRQLELLAARNTCINNLRMLDAASQQWALEAKKKSEDRPTMEILKPYFAQDRDLVCPLGGVYTLGAVSQAPRCSIPDHFLADQ